jgi:hypothetical protein
MPLGEGAQLGHLILRVLALITGRHAGINGNSHGSKYVAHRHTAHLAYYCGLKRTQAR